ncbi:MAG: rRNA pseudouridine synthase [Clostridia bacterium]|nr:rRNA pseudouridine synthase [Clostridia bacterium]
MEKIRLQKILADCGIASRRKAEELITQGRVRVNGKIAMLGDKANMLKDKITVNGRKVAAVKTKTYIMLHKPRGFVTTMSDEMGRKCVAELVESVGKRVYPVGRLDRDSEGLLLMTDDGELANAITHPSTHVPKTYRVTVRGKVTEDNVTALSTGLMLEGRVTLPADVNVIQTGEDRTVMQIVLYEGRNRQIRKMCEQLGLEVIRLKRTAIGNIKMGMLKMGDWRELNDDELRSIKQLVQSSSARKRKNNED